MNGTVIISTPGIDPGSSLVELPTDLNDSSQQVTKGCSTSSSSNSFTATGRGGLPFNPNEGISTATPWSDTRDLSAFMHQAPVAESGKSSSEPSDSINTIVEISSWRINADGQVELVATQSPHVAAQPYATCVS